MPTYDYRCRACGTVTEVIHSMLDDGPSVCELCGGALRRVIHPSGIIFKGSGFYRNDSRASASSSIPAGEKGPATDKDSGSAPDSTPSTASSSEARTGSDAKKPSAESSST